MVWTTFATCLPDPLVPETEIHHHAKETVDAEPTAGTEGTVEEDGRGLMNAEEMTAAATEAVPEIAKGFVKTEDVNLFVITTKTKGIS